MFLIQLLFLAYCTLHSDAFSSVVGPRKWLRKLTYEEQQEIRQKCTPVNPVQDRILHGTFAKQGQFKHMAVLTHSDGSGGEMTLCTGTLITRRHIVTARHCFHTTEQTDSFPLKVGGVCHSIGEDGCNEIDMKELEYDFAIFDNNSTLKSEADISIIQLKKDVSDDLLESGNVSIACLPWSTLIETPTNMTLHGWGRIEGEQHAKHLRYGFANFSKYNDYSLVAYSNTSKGQVGADHGDSGSGVVAFNDKLNDYLLWGLTIKADNITGSSSEHITLLLNLSEYYEDLCFYIGLCPGSVEGLMPKLNMGGMYWHDIGARPEFATTQYFRPISDEANQNYWRKCNDTRFAYINGTFFHPNDEKPYVCDIDTSWANLLVLNNSKAMCSATAITDQHFITTKECFRKNIEANNLVNGTSNLTIQTSPTCYGDVEFVAWSYTHPLAIIQLVKDQINQPDEHSGKFSHICFDNAKFAEGYAFFNLSVKSYKSYSTLSDPLNSTQIAGLSTEIQDICNDGVNYVCSGPPKECQPAKPLETKCFLKNSSQPFNYSNLEIGGYVVADGVNLGAEGINVQNEMAKKQSILVYLKLQPFLGSLCIYLNLCDPYTHTYNSSAPFFSEFFYSYN